MARIAVIADARGVHGLRWIEALRTTGHEIFWIATRPTESSEPGVEFIELPSVTGSAFTSQVRMWKNTGLVVDALARWKIDLVQAQFLTPCGWYAWAARRPYIVHLWGSDVLRAPETPPHYRWLSNRALKGALAVTADSSNLLSAALRLCPSLRRGPVVSWGVDTSLFAPLSEESRGKVRERYGIKTPRFILFTRNFGPTMNAVELIRAFAALPEGARMGWSLVLKKGFPMSQSSEDVLRAVRDVGQGAQINVIETAMSYRDMAPLYGAASVFVTIPSIGMDGLPQSLLDAAASGCALVTSASRDALEAFGPGRLEGEIVEDPTSSDELSRTLLKAMSVDDDASARTRNRAFIQREYERSLCVRRISDLTSAALAKIS